MKKIYFDSSAYTKIFANEEGTDAAREIIRLALESNNNTVQIIMSVWTINETISAIDQKAHQTREITLEQGKQIIATILQRSKEYSRRSQSKIVFVPVEYDIIKGSTVLIHSLHISADDALHVFTAFYHDCQYFICKDKGIKLKADRQMPIIQSDNQIPRMFVLDITKREEMTQLLNNL